MSSAEINVGQSGIMRMEESGKEVLFLLAYGDQPGSILTEVPWSYTANGQLENWRSGSVSSGPRNFTQLGRVWIDDSQTVTFHLGATGTPELGGPYDLDLYVSRDDALGVAYLTVNGIKVRGIPYVNVAGVWHQAEPYSKQAGVWKQTT